MPPPAIPAPARVTLVLSLLGLGAIVPACTPSRRQITPTTLGADLGQLPRGRMTPTPFPGNDLARRPGRPTLDSATALASGADR